MKRGVPAKRRREKTTGRPELEIAKTGEKDAAEGRTKATIATSACGVLHRLGRQPARQDSAAEAVRATQQKQREQRSELERRHDESPGVRNAAHRGARSRKRAGRKHRRDGKTARSNPNSAASAETADKGGSTQTAKAPRHKGSSDPRRACRKKTLSRRQKTGKRLLFLLLRSVANPIPEESYLRHDIVDRRHQVRRIVPEHRVKAQTLSYEGIIRRKQSSRSLSAL